MTHNTLEQILDEYISPLNDDDSSEPDDEDKCSEEVLHRYLECLTNGKHKKRRRCISGELGAMRFD